MGNRLTEQENLFGYREESIGDIIGSNQSLYTFARLVKAISDECVLNPKDSNTLHTRVVDAATVALIDAEIVIENTLDDRVGVDINYLSNRLQNKPRSEGKDADVTIECGRPYGYIHFALDTDWQIADRLPHLDPDSVRPAPDDIELFEGDTAAFSAGEINVGRLADWILSTPEKHNAIEVEADAGDLVLGQITSDNEGQYTTVARRSGGMGPEDKQSLFSPNYLTDIMSALKAVNAKTVTVGVMDDYPLMVEFVIPTPNPVRGAYYVAPRRRDP